MQCDPLLDGHSNISERKSGNNRGANAWQQHCGTVDLVRVPQAPLLLWYVACSTPAMRCRASICIVT